MAGSVARSLRRVVYNAARTPFTRSSRHAHRPSSQYVHVSRDTNRPLPSVDIAVTWPVDVFRSEHLPDRWFAEIILDGKLQEMSEKLSKATVDVDGLEPAAKLRRRRGLAR